MSTMKAAMIENPRHEVASIMNSANSSVATQAYTLTITALGGGLLWATL